MGFEFLDFLIGTEVEFLGGTYHLIGSAGVSPEPGVTLYKAVNTRAVYPAPVVVIPVRFEPKKTEAGG